MNNRLSKLALYVAVALMLPVGLGSCGDMLDTSAEEVLEYSDHYRTIYDADAAVIGLYGKFMNLAEQVVILNELRGDMMDVTTNASQYLREINNLGAISDANPYADATPFYNMIYACNDVLYNLNVMIGKAAMRQAEYNERYSDVGALRCWLYLQLAAQFRTADGKIPYITQPLNTLGDVEEMIADYEAQRIDPRAASDKVRLLDVDALLDSLVAFAETLPHTWGYSINYGNNRSNQLWPYTSGTANGYENLTATDNVQPWYLYINKNALLGDLYLFRGKDAEDYANAAKFYRRILTHNIHGIEFNTSVLNTPYRHFRWATDGGTGGTSSSMDNINSVYTVAFVRDDANRPDNSTFKYITWGEMFRDNPNDARPHWQHLWMMIYHKSYLPEVPFVKLFSYKYGDYMVRPSQWAIDSVWGNGQYFRNVNEWGDARGEKTAYTYELIDGEEQPIILKYVRDYETYMNTDVLSRSTVYVIGRWIIYRSDMIYNRLGEAAARYAKFVSNGTVVPVKTYPTLGNTGTVSSSQYYRFAMAVALYGDQTYSSIFPRGDTIFPEEGFAVRFVPGSSQSGTGSTAMGNPRHSVAQADLTLDSDEHMIHFLTAEERADSTLWMESLILREAAQNYGLEGARWFDLVRVAHRREKEQPGSGTAFLNRTLLPKFEFSTTPTTQGAFTGFSSEDDWYLLIK